MKTLSKNPRVEELEGIIKLLLDVHDGKLDVLDFDAQGMEEDLRWEMARKAIAGSDAL